MTQRTSRKIDASQLDLRVGEAAAGSGRATFASGDGEGAAERDHEIERLNAKIGEFIVERDFLAKMSGNEQPRTAADSLTETMVSCRSAASASCSGCAFRPVPTAGAGHRQRSGRDMEKLRALAEVQPRFDTVIGGFVDGNAVMRAQ